MSAPFTIGLPYAADRFGGSNVSSFVMAQALAEAGHRVHIIAHGTGPVTEEASKLGFAIERLPALSRIPGYARPDRFRLEQMFAFRTCRDALRRLNLDIVHTNDLGMLRTWAMPALIAGVPFVAHWRTNFRKSWSVEAGLHVARAVVAVSNYSARALPQFARAKTIVEYNALDLEYSRERKRDARIIVRKKLGVPPNAALIGIFGNHTMRKRTHVLADILHALRATDDGRIIVGLACGAPVEPYDRLLDEKIAHFGLEARLLRPGFMRPVEDWMAACDVILAPAVDEPLARNVLEAQALGVPVIVSTDGGLRELIIDRKTGFLCAPDDLPGWIAATRLLLNDPALAIHLTENARAVVAHLKPQAHAQRIARIYGSVLCQETNRVAA